MNGYLHLGHAFSMSKAEFQIRYQRQRGKKVLFPQGFHCTGMPIQAAAGRLKREIESGQTTTDDANQGLTQYEIMKMLNIDDQDIPKFQDPTKWIEHFPQAGQQDIQSFGMNVDWRRSFVTTDVNPFYDSFIKW